MRRGHPCHNRARCGDRQFSMLPSTPRHVAGRGGTDIVQDRRTVPLSVSGLGLVRRFTCPSFTYRSETSETGQALQ